MKKALPAQCVFQDANDGRAKDGETKLAMSERLGPVEQLVGGGVARPQPLATAVLFVGVRFAHGRRTATTWLRAAGVWRRLARLLLSPRWDLRSHFSRRWDTTR